MNTRLFIANLSMVLLLLAVSGYQLVFYYTATAHNDLSLPLDRLVYCLWVFVFVMTADVGREVIKDFDRAEQERWIRAQVPPLFPEGALL
jgi:hypothetical protein